MSYIVSLDGQSGQWSLIDVKSDLKIPVICITPRHPRPKILDLWPSTHSPLNPQPPQPPLPSIVKCIAKVSWR